MLKADVIKFFGTAYKVAKALGIDPPIVYRWGEIVPPLRQLQLEHVTRGRLKADPTLMPKRPPKVLDPLPTGGSDA